MSGRFSTYQPPVPLNRRLPGSQRVGSTSHRDQYDPQIIESQGQVRREGT